MPDEQLRGLIAGGASMLDMTQAARRLGARTLYEDAFDKMRQGVTSADEVLRVLGPIGA